MTGPGSSPGTDSRQDDAERIRVCVNVTVYDREGERIIYGVEQMPRYSARVNRRAELDALRGRAMGTFDKLLRLAVDGALREARS